MVNVSNLLESRCFYFYDRAYTSAIQNVKSVEITWIFHWHTGNNCFYKIILQENYGRPTLVALISLWVIKPTPMYHLPHWSCRTLKIQSLFSLKKCQHNKFTFFIDLNSAPNIHESVKLFTFVLNFYIVHTNLCIAKCKMDQFIPICFTKKLPVRSCFRTRVQ